MTKKEEELAQSISMMEKILASKEKGDHEASTKKTIFKQEEFEQRVVDANDICDWCVELPDQCSPEEPNGVIIRIPNYFLGMILMLEGSLSSFKDVGTTLFLQVDTSKEDRTYHVDHTETGKINVIRT